MEEKTEECIYIFCRPEGVKLIKEGQKSKQNQQIVSDSQTVSGLSIKCAKRSPLFHQCPPTTTFLSFSSHHLIVQSLWD